MTRVTDVLSEARDVLASRLLQPLSAFVLLIVIGRSSDRLLGEYALVSTAYIVLQTLPLLGLLPFFVREAARDPGRIRTLLAGIGGMAVTAALALGMVWWALRNRVDHPDSIREALDVVAIGIAGGVVAHLCEALLVCLQQARIVLRIAVYENLGRLAASLAVLSWTPSVRDLFIVFFAGRALALLAMMMALARQRLAPIRPGDPVGLLRQLGPQLPAFFGAMLLALAASRLDFLVLSRYVDLSLLGLYAISYRYLEIAMLLVTAVIAAAYPRLSSIFHHDPARFREIARSLIEIAMWGLPMLAVGAVLASDAYVALLFPRHHPQAVALAGAFAVLIALLGLDALLSALLQSCDRQADDLAAQAMGTAVLALGLLLLVPRLYAWGAFWAAFGAVATQVSLRLWIVRRRDVACLQGQLVGRLAVLAGLSLLLSAGLAQAVGQGLRLLLIPILPPLAALVTLTVVRLHPGAWLRALARPLAPGAAWDEARLGDTLRLLAEDQRALERARATGRACHLARPASEGAGRPLPRSRWPLFGTPGTRAMALYRISHWALRNGQGRLAGACYRLNIRMTGADIHPASQIGPGCVIVRPQGIVIHGRLGQDVTL